MSFPETDKEGEETGVPGEKKKKQEQKTDDELQN